MQEEMKKFANRKCGKGEEYRVEDLVLLSYKGFKMADKREKIEEIDRTFHGLLQSQGNCL